MTDSWPPRISLLHDLNFVLHFYKSAFFSLYRASVFAGRVGGLPEVASSCSFAEENKNVLSHSRMASGDLPLSHTNKFEYVELLLSLSVA